MADSGGFGLLSPAPYPQCTRRSRILSNSREQGRTPIHVQSLIFRAFWMVGERARTAKNQAGRKMVPRDGIEIRSIYLKS